MLELARELAKADRKFFRGWILAGAEIKIKGPAEKFTLKTLLEKKRLAILEVTGLDAKADAVKSIKVTLLLPEKEAGGKKMTGVPEGDLLAEHVFTEEDIADYAEKSGDANIIHKGENPVVPGLFMAYKLQHDVKLAALYWEIRFLTALHAGEKVAFYKKGGLIAAWSGSVPVFTIKSK